MQIPSSRFKLFIVNLKKNFRNIFLSVLLAVLPSMGIAQDMESLLLSMPKQVIPYLPGSLMSLIVHQYKESLIEIGDSVKESSTVNDVQNAFGGNSRVDTLTADYAMLSLSDVVKYEFLAFPCGGDTCVCVVRNIATPELESTVDFYDKAWNYLGRYDEYAPVVDYESDSISAEQKEIAESQELQIRSVHIDAASSQLLFTLQFPMLSADDKKVLNGLLLQRNVKIEDVLLKIQRKTNLF